MPKGKGYGKMKGGGGSKTSGATGNNNSQTLGDPSKMALKGYLGGGRVGKPKKGKM